MGEETDKIESSRCSKMAALLLHTCDAFTEINKPLCTHRRQIQTAELHLNVGTRCRSAVTVTTLYIEGKNPVPNLTSG